MVSSFASPVFDSAVAPRAVYVHVPFCLHHCGYCDFTVIANRDHLIPNYLAAIDGELTLELREWPRPIAIDTLFLGGGTPSHLPPADLDQLFAHLRGRFQFSPQAEITAESNPDGLDAHRLQVLQANGVNRLSLGVQSFDPQTLRTLERTHTPAEAVASVERAAGMFSSVSLDLIFGVPGQSVESWRSTLAIAMQLPITHISTYGLTYEQGTPFFRRLKSGGLTRVPEETERVMYLEAIDALTSQGFQQYEVSNFARPGHQCRHNRVYWRGEEYFAFGPGASRYVHGVRSTNCRSVVRWLTAWRAGTPCIEETEQLTLEEKSREAIMLALRMTEGLHVPTFEARFQTSLRQLAGSAIDRHTKAGLLELHGESLRLTRSGFLIADSVIIDFL